MIPSVKKLMEITNGDKVKAQRLRAILEDAGQPSVALEACDAILGTCGVEYIPAGHNQKSPSILYCNTGDPYTWTILYYNRNFHVGCWGDIVERGNYD